MLKIILIAMILFLKNCFADIKAVLFDCDGTLVDSEYAHYLCWRDTLLDLGSDLKLDDYYQYVWKPADVIAELFAEKASGSPEWILHKKKEYYSKHLQAGLPPISATVQFLKNLAAEKESLGIKVGVCSAAKKEDILLHVCHLEIEDLLDIVLSGQDDLDEYRDPEGVNKPKPYIYQHAMKKLGVLPEETIVIEDSETGVAAGVAAGCFTIAVPNDYTKHKNFMGASLILDSFAEMTIPQLLQTVAK